MDYAAATPVRTECVDAMSSVLRLYGNPGGIHAHSNEAKEVYENARARIARTLAVKPHDIVVTASATEANNLAIRGFLHAYLARHTSEGNDMYVRPHIITTAIEHSSILEVFACEEVTAAADVTILPVDTHGYVRKEALLEALRPETILVSIGWANGEVGTIQHMRALAQTIRAYEQASVSHSTAHKHQIVLHTDAGQAPFAHNPQPQGTGVDMMTLSSGKLYGPRGVAVLYKPREIPLLPIMFGGHQEFGLRPGTEDVAPLMGFATALELLEHERKQDYARLRDLQSLFVSLVRTKLPRAVCNGDTLHGLPHIVNLSIPNIDSEYVALALDHRGVSISTKSVCVEATGEPASHVVHAMVANDTSREWRASTTLRFSFGKYTTKNDVRYATKVLAKIVHTHRK